MSTLHLALAATLLTACGAPSLRPELDAVNPPIARRGLPPLPAAPDPAAAALLADPLTPEAAARVALLRHGALAAEVAELAALRPDRQVAWPDPHLEAGLSKALSGDEAPDVEIAVEYPIGRAALLPVRRSAARQAQAAARWRVADAALATAQRARVALLHSQAAEARLAVQIEGLKGVQAAYAVALELRRVGNNTALALARERAAVEEARLAVAQAEAQAEGAREAVHRALGLAGAATTWRAAPLAAVPAAEPATADLEGQAVRHSLALQALDAQAQAEADRAGAAEAGGWLDDLAVGVRTERREGTWELGAMVGLALPLFDGGRGEGAQAEARGAGLRLRAEAAAVDVRSALRDARDRLLSARRQALHLRDAVIPAREAVLAESLRAYNAMQISVFQLLAAQRDLTAARGADVDARLAVGLAQATLHHLLMGGAPMEGAALPAAPQAPAAAADDGGHG